MVKIDADQVTEVRLSDDGARVLLTLIDDSRQKISASLPADLTGRLVREPQQAIAGIN